MGRHQTHVSAFRGRDGPRWSAPYYVEWGVVVGDRIRRLRQDRHWALKDLARRVPKPDGGGYSIGYFSRLERGWANAPLYVYLKIAEALDVEAGVLLGPDELQREVSAGERIVLDFMARAGIEPVDAVLRLSAVAGRREYRSRPERQS